MEDAAVYLRSKAVDVYRAASGEVTIHCVFCPDGDVKRKGKLYVNVETWLFDCKRCGERGGKKRLMEHFGDTFDESTYEAGKDPVRRRKVLEEYATLAESLLLKNEPRMLYLLRRGLSVETIDRARFGYAPHGFKMCEELPNSYKPGGFTRADLEASGMLTASGRETHQGRITIPYLTGGSVSQVRGKDPDGGYFTPAGDKVQLYNADALRGAKIAIVVEGEFDTRILEQHLDGVRTDVAVVGLPGAGSWPGGADGFQEFFEQCNRVYIGLDPDETGRRERVKMQALLGAKSRIIELPDDGLKDGQGEPVKCDWTEFLRDKSADHPYGGHTATDVLGLIHEADMAGKRVYSMGDAGARWLRDESERPGIKTGFPMLDSIIRPGFKPGNLVIPLAKTGTGKTVFLGNLAYNTRDLPTLFITLEMMAQEVYGILRKVTRFHHTRYDDAQIQSLFPYLRIVDENRLRREDFALLVQEYEDEVGVRPQQVFVDYLGYYSKGQQGGSPYEKTSNGVMQLKEEAKAHELVVISPHQVNRGAKDGKPFDAEDARDSGVVEETGDFVFGLFKPSESVDDARAKGIVSDALGCSILKSRKGGKGRMVNMSMSMASLAIVDASDRLAVNRIQIENSHYNRGEHYDDIYKRQRQLADEKHYESNQLDLQITGESRA